MKCIIDFYNKVAEQQHSRAENNILFILLLHLIADVH